MFYIAILVLVLLSIGLTVLAFRPQGKHSDKLVEQRIKRLIVLFKNNTEQLQQEHDNGVINEANFQSLYNDQARDLIETVEHLEAIEVKSGPLKGFIVAALLAIPLLAIGLYYTKGAYPDYKIAQELSVLSQIENATEYTEALSSIKETMEARVNQRPDAIEYRLLLAQLAMSNAQYTEALSHYSVIAELLPEDSQAQAYYAQALYLANNRQLNSQVATALDKTLELDPFQPTALGMVGILSFEAGDYRSAIEAWEKLMSVTAPATSRGQVIQKGLAEARQQLALSGESIAPAVANVETDALDAIAASITISLSLSEQLTAKVDPNLTVFVYAKAEIGPPMPLAVQRLRVADLPAVVTLNDSTAMTPNFKLSKFERVIVGARISKTGNAIAREGDITVEVSGFNWRKTPNHSILLEQK